MFSRGGVLALQQLAALGRQLAQHRVEHRDLAAEAAGGEAHRLGDRGVRRRRQEQELGGAQPQQVGDRQLLGPIAQERQSGVIDLAQAAQDGGDQEAREGPVPDGELGQLRVALEGLVERAMVAARARGRAHRAPHAARWGRSVGRDCPSATATPPGRRRGLGEAGLAPGEAATLAARRSAPVRRALGHAASASRRERALDQGAGLGRAVDGDEGAEARAFALAQQHLVQGLEPVAQIGEGVALADLVELVLDRLGVGILAGGAQPAVQLLERRPLLVARRAVAAGRRHEVAVVGDRVPDQGRQPRRDCSGVVPGA